MFKNVIKAIGNTPLVDIDFSPDITLCAKLEYLNPGGSVKDRSAMFMIEHAEREGLLKPGGTIVDASSGNQGISMAMIGAIKGYRVVIAAAKTRSAEKLDAMRAYGAQVVLCPSTKFVEDPEGAHATAKKLAQEIPGAFMPNQYFNPLNAQAHYSLLAPEIWQQTGGNITHFFAAAGTGGTISGVGKYLKEKNPAIKIIGVDSNHSFRATKGNPKPYVIEGMGIDFESPVMNYSVIDEIKEVADQDALAMMRTIAQKYGIIGGMTCGAVAYAAQQHIVHMKKNDYGVMIFGDSGRAYLSKNIY